MRSRVFLTVVLAWIMTVPLSLAHAEEQQPIQTRYLNIYLKINDAEHLEKQGDYRGALEDFKDCYAKLAKIHQTEPDWETALVVHRMDDCKAKILDLQAKVNTMPPETPTPAPSTPAPSTNGEISPAPPLQSGPAPSEDVTALKQELQAVKTELQITKDRLKDSQAQLETYRAQLETVNQQLAALKNQQSVDDRMGKVLSENKALTDKLAAAQKEIDEFRSNPKSKLALAQAQLKNLQDQYAASQEANKALQDTTTTLKQQLDQANADLVTANQKLAAAGTGSPEYQTLKRENEIMRDILTRELQEQAHRDMAKRLAQEEFDNLKLKSKVLQEQLDILGSPMTPPTNDQERALLASLKVPGPDITQPPGSGFAAQVPGPAPSTDQTTTNAPSATPPAPTAPDTNMASATPPATNMASATPPATDTASAMPPASNSATGTAPSAPVTDNTTNQPPITIVMNNSAPANNDTTTPPPPPATNAVPDTSATNAPASVTPPVVPSGTPDTTAPPSTPPPTNTPDTNAPTPPSAPIDQSASAPSATNTMTPAAPSVPPASTEPTTTKLPPATTVYQDTTIKNGGGAAKQDDPTQYSTKARLPDDMRETARDAADLFKKQKYDESAAKYQNIIDKYPESLYAWSNLGVVRFQQGKYSNDICAS